MPLLVIVPELLQHQLHRELQPRSADSVVRHSLFQRLHSLLLPLLLHQDPQGWLHVSGRPK
ncbi:MAG: hypothetical protein F9K46_11365 [Anaerolineae bacterium]|nr:MAG: hypothetical protein F9K46_11365 [Anaerolineae bacterium]